MITLTNEDNLELFKRLGAKSVDIICIDPPYLYLKNQKLERPFDETLFFQQCFRVLKNNGFIIMFGRGSSFYRMNTILDRLGLEFKEEIVWDKTQNSSPVLAISRVHETISIYGKGKAKIIESRIPYTEIKDTNFESIQQDLKRIKTGLNNTKSLEALISYVEKGVINYDGAKTRKFHATVQGVVKEQDRAVKIMQSIVQGMKEKSILKIGRDHYNTLHPTQKPVRLLERLLSICLPDKPKEEITVADFFGGSFSCAEACINLGVNFIGCEIDKEYFDKGQERIQKIILNDLY